MQNSPRISTISGGQREGARGGAPGKRPSPIGGGRVSSALGKCKIASGALEASLTLAGLAGLAAAVADELGVERTFSALSRSLREQATRQVNSNAAATQRPGLTCRGKR